MRKTRVGILFGGVSGEHEVSLMSARSIIGAISKEKYEPVQVGIDHAGRWWSGENTLERFQEGSLEGLHRVTMFPFADHGNLYKINERSVEPTGSLDVIFPILHGTFGEDGNLQGYLELMDIPYVGANVASSAVSMEKGLFKALMRAHDLPVLDYLLTSRKEVASHPQRLISRAETMLQYPMFVKPVNLGSSIGVNLCRGRSDLLKGLEDAAKYSTKIAVEQGIDAREIEISVLGDESKVLVSVPGEVHYNDEFYSYKAKYHDTQTELIIPAPLEDQIAEEIRRIAGLVYQIVGCEGMARIDFLLEKSSSKIFINELNTIPGFTHASMYPRLWLQEGMSYEKLIDRLIELAFERHAERQQTSFRYIP